MSGFEVEQTQYARDLARMIRADEYTLHHLAIHLYSADQHKRLYNLLLSNKAWMEAKFQRLTGDMPYNYDLETAIKSICDPVSPEDLLTLTQLYAAKMVVNWRNSNYSNEHLKLLVLMGCETEALEHAHLKSDPVERCSSLLAIYRQLNERDHNNPLLQEIINEIRKIHLPLISNDFEKSETLLSLTSLLAETRHIDEAIRFASQISYVRHRSIALINIARVLFQIGRESTAARILQDVEGMTSGFEDQWINQEKVAILCNLGEALFEAGQLNQSKLTLSRALKITMQDQDDLRDKISTLCLLAETFAKVGDSAQSETILLDAIEEAKKSEYKNKMPSEIGKAAIRSGHFQIARQFLGNFVRHSDFDHTHSGWPEVQQELAKALVQEGQYDEAQEIINQIRFLGDQIPPMCELARALLQSGHVREAKRYLLMVRQRTRQDLYFSSISGSAGVKALDTLAIAFAEMGQKGEAFEILNEALQRFYYDYSDCIKIAKTMFKLGDRAGAMHALSKALENPVNPWNTKDKAAMLIQIMEALAQVGLTDEAKMLVGHITRLTTDIPLDYIQRILAVALSRARQFEKALEIVWTIQESPKRLAALLGIAIEAAVVKDHWLDEIVDNIRQNPEFSRGYVWYQESIDQLAKLAKTMTTRGYIPALILELVLAIVNTYRLGPGVLVPIATAFASVGQINDALIIIDTLSRLYNSLCK